MKFVLEIEESKAATLMALLNDLPYVKTTPLTPYDENALDDLNEIFDKLNLALPGKIDAQDADKL